MRIPAQMFENWAEIPNKTLLFLFRSLKMSRFRILLKPGGMAELTMLATIEPKLAIPDP
jgi:hypothetical protein